MTTAADFLRALDPDPNAQFDFITLRSRDDASRSFRGTFAEHEAELRRLNLEHGFSVYVMPNMTDGDNILHENVVRARAWFTEVDFKDLPPLGWQEVWSLPAGLPPPSVMVSSAHGPHLYWLPGTDQTITLPEWDAQQRAIQRLVGGDPSVGRRNQLMRMPGFNHEKGVFVRVHLNEEIRYSNDEISQFFPVQASDLVSRTPRSEEGPVVMSPEERAWAIAEVSAILERREPDLNNGAQPSSWTYKTCALVADYVDNVEDALKVLRPWNARSVPPLPESELRKRWDHAVEYRRNRLGSAVADHRFEEQLDAWSERVQTEKPAVATIEFSEFDPGPAIAKAVESISRDPALYQWGGQLVYLYETPLPPSVARTGPAIQPHNFETLGALISSHCRFFQTKEDKQTGQLVPSFRPTPPSVVNGILFNPQAFRSVRPLRRVVTSPVITSAGDISKAGYLKDLGLVYYPVSEYEDPPRNPTTEEVAAARDRILDVVCDFPFESDAHKAAWLAMTLTPFVQWIYGGRAPFFLIEANTPGSGKGLLAEVMLQICYGRALTPVSMDFDDNAEVTKQLVSLVLAQSPVVLVDNIEGNVGGSAFDMATTADFYKGRVLGKSQMVEGPMDFIWVGTGNNVGIQGDAERRLQIIRLRSDLERPQDRTGFKHGNYAELKEFIKNNRTGLVTDCLTVWRGWWNAGKPSMSLPTWGSFDGWSRYVRSCVVWLGLPDPKLACATITSSRDSGMDAFSEFLEKYDAVCSTSGGMLLRDLVARCSNPLSPKPIQDLHGPLVELTGTSPLNLNSVARRLGKLKGRVVNGRSLHYVKDSEGNRKWTVKKES